MRPRSRAIAAAVLSAFASACGNGEDRPDETPPVLSEPMIDLSHVIEFLPFGSPLPGSGVLNPTYELRTDVNTIDVVAAAPGTVVAIRTNTEGDAEIEIRPVERSIYAVIYDHVRDTTVSVGAAVSPGTVLGRIGFWGMTQGRTELQVNKDGNPTLALCPVQFGTAAFNDAHAAALAATGSTSSICVQDTVVP